MSVNKSASIEYNDEYSNPLDISDVLEICKEYQQLGWNLQNQLENIIDVGIEETINRQLITKQHIPMLKKFLKCIQDNYYLGDASIQAKECLIIIQEYEDKNKINYMSSTIN